MFFFIMRIIPLTVREKHKSGPGRAFLICRGGKKTLFLSKYIIRKTLDFVITGTQETVPADERSIFGLLDRLGISYQCYEHPPTPTIESAMAYWKDIDATHCKNLFFRNHKGNQHYLVVLECTHDLDIHDLEHKLHQGKLSFASPERMMRYLGVTPGSVSPFGLINDTEHHVIVFLDERLKQAGKLSFHPNRNTASVVLTFPDFIKYMDWTQNPYRFVPLYTP